MIGRGCVIKPGAVIKDSVVLAGAVIGDNVHIEGHVVDKYAKITRMKELVAEPGNPGYVKRNDIV